MHSGMTSRCACSLPTIMLDWWLECVYSVISHTQHAVLAGWTQIRCHKSYIAVELMSGEISQYIVLHEVLI